ncbi:TPA: hypothetical protein ACN31Q_000457 [Vibrio campbellii]
MKKILLITAFALGGCASQQELKENNFEDNSNKVLFEQIEKLKEKEKDYEEVEIKLIDIVENSKFEKKKISFNFTGRSTLDDLLNVFEFYGINAIVDGTINTDQRIIINKYDGGLEDLLNGISENTNLSFEEKNGILYIRELKNYKIKVVQDKEIIDAVKEELEKMEEEIKELVVSDTAGVFSFKSDYKTFNKIKGVVEDINNNTSLINIDLSLINVELNQSSGNGFDWKSLNIAANLNPADIVNEGLSIVGGERLSVQSKKFNFNLVMNVLNEYGQSETIQNTSIKTLSGKEATFKTTEKTPYIDKVEVNNNGEFTETGFTTAETETGLEISVLPYFDKKSKMVNVKVDVVNSALKGFLNISNNDYEVSQPQTEEQNFNSVIRLKTGETSVVGGIVYYKKDKSGNNFIDEITQSNKKELSKNALFIVIKPSVKAYVYK